MTKRKQTAKEKKNKKFEDILTDELRKYFNVLYKNKRQRKLLGQRMKNYLFGKDLEKEITPIAPLTKREKFLGDIFKDYYEIFISLENMKMIAIFVRQYPNYRSYKAQRITKTKYLRYHIENYLNEIYIFEKRVEKFLNKLIKKLKSKNLRKEIDKVEKLKDLLYKSLEKAKSIRGIHVHQFRFTDKKLEQLDSLELLTSNDKLKLLGFYKDLEYRQTRSKWSKIINQNNEALQKLLDHILEEVKSIVFNKLISYYKNGSKN